MDSYTMTYDDEENGAGWLSAASGICSWCNGTGICYDCDGAEVSHDGDGACMTCIGGDCDQCEGTGAA